MAISNQVEPELKLSEVRIVPTIVQRYVCTLEEQQLIGAENKTVTTKDKREGRYTAGYDLETGKRIIKNVLGKTQAEVKEKLAQAQQETSGLDVGRNEAYTVATWLRS